MVEGDSSQSEVNDSVNSGIVDNSFWNLIHLHITVVTSITLGLILIAICIGVRLVTIFRMCSGLCHTIFGVCCKQCMEGPDLLEICVTRGGHKLGSQTSFQLKWFSLGAERELSLAPSQAGPALLQPYPNLNS